VQATAESRKGSIKTAKWGVVETRITAKAESGCSTVRGVSQHAGGRKWVGGGKRGSKTEWGSLRQEIQRFEKGVMGSRGLLKIWGGGNQKRGGVE